MSESLQSQKLQYARLPCPSLSPEVCSNSCPLGCNAIQSSHSLLPPSLPQSFPALGSFPMSWVFTLGGQSIGASTSTSVLPMNIQCWFPLGLTVLIFLLSQGLSRVFSNTTVQKHQFFGTQPSCPTLTSIHDYWKHHSFDYMAFVSKAMSLFLNILSRLVIAFLPRSKHLLISWLQLSPSAILEPKKMKYVTVSTFPPVCHDDGTRCHNLSFLKAEGSCLFVCF